MLRSLQIRLLKAVEMVELTFRALRLPKALPLARSWQSTSVYRSYTDGRMWLNLVMKACLSQSTSISETITVSTGYNRRQISVKKALNRRSKNPTYDIVQITLFPLNQPKLCGRTKPWVKSISVPLSSMRLRNATTVSMRASVNRSTISVK